MNAISRASPSPIGETCAVEGIRHHDGDAADHRGDRRPGGAARRFRGTRSRRCSAAISGTPACISRMLATVGIGERHDEAGRGGGEAERHRQARQAHAGEQRQRAAPAVAPDHEGDAGRRPPRASARTPPSSCPAVDEAGDRAAEAPDHGRQEDEQETQRLVPAQAARRTGGNAGGGGRLLHGAGPADRQMSKMLRRASQFARFAPDPPALAVLAQSPYWKSKALKPVETSSRPSGRVTGGSARARQPTRSQSRQAGPIGVARPRRTRRRPAAAGRRHRRSRRESRCRSQAARRCGAAVRRTRPAGLPACAQTVRNSAPSGMSTASTTDLAGLGEGGMDRRASGSRRRSAPAESPARRPCESGCRQCRSPA